MIFKNWVSSVTYQQGCIIRFLVASLKVSNLITIKHFSHLVLDNNEAVGFLKKYWSKQLLNMSLV